MDTSVLKKPALWVAVVVALAGVAMSQGLIMEGSTPAEVIGWIMAVLGTFFGGKTSAQPAPANDAPSA